MRRVIFYSWQSDLPNPTNRGFIQQALENVAKAIVSDNTVDVEPVIDRDTLGVAGSPDISATIFAKIAVADIVVVDISIIGQLSGGRSTPNPNVLIELGYALKALGHERVVLVFNSAFGKIDLLPFDLRTRRIMVYNMPEAAIDRSTERKKLESQLNSAILSALMDIPEVSETGSDSELLHAIEHVQPNRVIILRKKLGEFLKKLDSNQPKKHSEGGTVDDLTGAIEETQEIVAEFSKIVETISIMSDSDSIQETCRWFGNIFERYNRPQGLNGSYSTADYDYYKFVGHEMFVSMVAFMIREQRWALLDLVLSEPISMKYEPSAHGPTSVNWEYASEHLSLLLDESNKQRRVSIHADIIMNRHTTGGLSAILPFDDFMAADFFLFLRGELLPEQTNDFMEWRAWSNSYLKNVPAFITYCQQARVAESVIKVLKVPSIDEFKRRLTERVPRLGKLFNSMFWRSPIENADIASIGTR